MSRSGYSEDCEYLAVWRGQVASAIRGKRGQAFFRALVEALDAMTEKKLIEGHIRDESGAVCSLGALGVKRGFDLDAIDPHAYHELGDKFDIARQLAQEVMYENDEGAYRETPEQRWQRMRTWAAEQIRVTPEECNAVELPDSATGKEA